MAHDVFVSHSVKDKAVDDAIVARLEADSVTCWIAPRDVVPGADWGESIIDAIESSRIMILIFSRSADASSQIKREVERAVNKGVYIGSRCAETPRSASAAPQWDLNVDKAAYWRWVPPIQLETFSRKNWPSEIIETFERHGFTLGGKWWHFDTMHFEYRPEIIAYAKSVAPSAPEIKSVY